MMRPSRIDMSSLLQDIHGKLSVCHMPGHAIVLIVYACSPPALIIGKAITGIQAFADS